MFFVSFFKYGVKAHAMHGGGLQIGCLYLGMDAPNVIHTTKLETDWCISAKRWT